LQAQAKTPISRRNTRPGKSEIVKKKREIQTVEFMTGQEQTSREKRSAIEKN